MPNLPGKDERDEVRIGPVSVPVVDEEDPAEDQGRAAWSAARVRAQSLHNTDELVAGLSDDNWHVRHEVVDRLVARAGDDPRTLPKLLDRLALDPEWQVRDAIAMALLHYPADATAVALRAAVGDSHQDVRWSASYVLHQLGLGPWPGDCP